MRRRARAGCAAALLADGLAELDEFDRRRLAWLLKSALFGNEDKPRFSRLRYQSWSWFQKGATQ